MRGGGASRLPNVVTHVQRYEQRTPHSALDPQLNLRVFRKLPLLVPDFASPCSLTGVCSTSPCTDGRAGGSLFPYSADMPHAVPPARRTSPRRFGELCELPQLSIRGRPL